ncbi:MAG: hypothetical protein HC836_40875 [Richelia sp. RM2_1_2]|nr:hypothetical protein [Richelia sp. RM2_1_2]
MKYKNLVSLPIILIIAGCATSDAAKPQSALPALPQYDEAFRMKFADEVDHICGNEAKGIAPEYKNACIFIQDALVLRKQIKAIKE